MELDESILLQKQVKDNSEDLRSEFLDLKNWEEEMKRKERELINERNEQVFDRNIKKCRCKSNYYSKFYGNMYINVRFSRNIDLLFMTFNFVSTNVCYSKVYLLLEVNLKKYLQ